MQVSVTPIVQPERMCGFRKEEDPMDIGAAYLVPAESSPDGSIPLVTVLDSPIPVSTIKPHRGPLQVNGNNILDCKPEEDWFVGSSAETRQKNSAEVWEKELFGMTTVKRLKTGDLKGSKTAEEAIQTLEACVTWDDRIDKSLRQLSLNRVNEFPGAAGPFAKLCNHVLAYRKQDAGTLALIQAVGDIWEMADHCHTRYRPFVIPHLASMLVLMGLTKDAIALKSAYKV